VGGMGDAELLLPGKEVPPNEKLKAYRQNLKYKLNILASGQFAMKIVHFLNSGQ
jgi:hypothetical protein